MAFQEGLSVGFLWAPPVRTGGIKGSGVGYPHVALAITSNAHRSLENTIVNKLGVVVSIDEVNTVVVVAGDPGIPHGINGYIKGFVQTEMAIDLALFRIAVHKFCNTGGLAIGHPDVALFVRNQPRKGLRLDRGLRESPHPWE